jgi:hypothetical protein
MERYLVGKMNCKILKDGILLYITDNNSAISRMPVPP